MSVRKCLYMYILIAWVHVNADCMTNLFYNMQLIYYQYVDTRPALKKLLAEGSAAW